MSSLVLVSQSLLNKMKSSVSEIESNEYVLEAKLIPDASGRDKARHCDSPHSEHSELLSSVKRVYETV
jgi:hypothetical protein